MTIKLDKINIDRAKAFFGTYKLENIIGDSDTIIYFGNKNPRICRFCLKSNDEVSFNMDAHIIPQFMGNKNLLSYFECNNCNKLFSKYEDSFANFFGISRTFSQIKGQSKKVPKFKDFKTGLEVYLGADAMQIIMSEGRETVKIDDKNNIFEITTERPGYVPIHIPKMMIKMGLSMLNDADIENYDYARRFILQSEKDEFFKDNHTLRIYGYFIPGPPKFIKPFVHLYKKKDKSRKKIISRQIVLFYANYCFQMLLPFGKNDQHLEGKSISYLIYPLLIDNSHFDKFGPYQQLNFNLTSHIKQSGQEHKITFSYEKSERKI